MSNRTGDASIRGNTCLQDDSDEDGTCLLGTDGSPDFMVRYTAPRTGMYTFSTDNAATTYDSALYIRDACGGSVVACDDNSGSGLSARIEDFAMTVDEEVILAISGSGASDCGVVDVDINVEWCGNGLADPVNGEECDDGNNDDGDGCSADCQDERDP